VQTSGNGKAAGAPAKYAGFGVGSANAAVSVGDVDAELLRDTVAAVTGDGDAIMFGRTTDGGALSVSVYSGGRRAVVYFTDVGSLQNALVELKHSALTQ
jgi:hypothetical protein